MSFPENRERSNARARARRANDPAFRLLRNQKYREWLDNGGRAKLKIAKDAYRASPIVKAREKDDAFKRQRSTIGRYQSGKGHAKKRGLAWELSLEAYATIISQPCHYCLGPLNPTSGGLDRIDNDKGYLPDNVLPCCRKCNSTRGMFWTVQETLIMIRTVMRLPCP